MSLLFFIFTVFKYGGKRDAFLVPSGISLFLSLIHAGAHLCTAYAVGTLTLTRMLVLSYADLLCFLFLSPLLLRRLPALGQLLALLFALAAAFLEFFVSFSGGAFQLALPTIDPLPISLFLGARVLYALRNILAKRAAVVSSVHRQQREKMNLSPRAGHLFSARLVPCELRRTRLDALYDCMLFDTEYFGPTASSTWQLHLLGGWIAVCPTSYLVAFIKGELVTPPATHTTFTATPYTSVASLSVDQAVIFGCIALVLLLRTVIQWPYVFYATRSAFVATRALVVVATFFVAALLFSERFDVVSAGSIFLLVCASFINAQSVKRATQRRQMRWCITALERHANGEIEASNMGETDEDDTPEYSSTELRALSANLGTAALSRTLTRRALHPELSCRTTTDPSLPIRLRFLRGQRTAPSPDADAEAEGPEDAEGTEIAPLSLRTDSPGSSASGSSAPEPSALPLHQVVPPHLTDAPGAVPLDYVPPSPGAEWGAGLHSPRPTSSFPETTSLALSDTEPEHGAPLGLETPGSTEPLNLSGDEPEGISFLDPDSPAQPLQFDDPFAQEPTGDPLIHPQFSQVVDAAVAAEGALTANAPPVNISVSATPGTPPPQAGRPQPRPRPLSFQPTDDAPKPPLPPTAPRIGPPRPRMAHRTSSPSSEPSFLPSPATDESIYNGDPIDLS